MGEGASGLGVSEPTAQLRPSLGDVVKVWGSFWAPVSPAVQQGGSICLVEWL